MMEKKNGISWLDLRWSEGTPGTSWLHSCSKGTLEAGVLINTNDFQESHWLVGWLVGVQSLIQLWVKKITQQKKGVVQREPIAALVCGQRRGF